MARGFSRVASRLWHGWDGLHHPLDRVARREAAYAATAGCLGLSLPHRSRASAWRWFVSRYWRSSSGFLSSLALPFPFPGGVACGEVAAGPGGWFSGARSLGALIGLPGSSFFRTAPCRRFWLGPLRLTWPQILQRCLGARAGWVASWFGVLLLALWGGGGRLDDGTFRRVLAIPVLLRFAGGRRISQQRQYGRHLASLRFGGLDAILSAAGLRLVWGFSLRRWDHFSCCRWRGWIRRLFVALAALALCRVSSRLWWRHIGNHGCSFRLRIGGVHSRRSWTRPSSFHAISILLPAAPRSSSRDRLRLCPPWPQLCVGRWRAG